MEPAPEAPARSAGVVDQLRRQCEWPARKGRGLISVMKIGNDVYVILVCARLRRSHRIGDSLGGVSGHQFERAATDPVGDHLCVRARSVGRSDALRTCVRMRGGDKAMYCARAQTQIGAEAPNSTGLLPPPPSLEEAAYPCTRSCARMQASLE